MAFSLRLEGKKPMPNFRLCEDASAQWPCRPGKPVRSSWEDAEQAPHQLLLAVAQKPGESHNLARMHAEGDVLDRPLHAQVLHPQKLLADLVLLVDLYAQHVPADHHARDVGLADLLAVRLHNRAVGHLLAVAQNRVAVAKIYHFVEFDGI